MPRSQVLVVAFVVAAAALTLSWFLSGLIVGGSVAVAKGQELVLQIEAEEAAAAAQRREAERIAARSRLEAEHARQEARRAAERANQEFQDLAKKTPLPIAPWAEIPEFRPPKVAPRPESPRPEQWIHNPKRLPSPKRSGYAASIGPVGLLWSQQYDKLEATLEAWDELPRGDNGRRPIERAVVAIDRVRGSLEDLGRWLEAKPESYWARLFVARALIDLAWEYRSNAMSYRIRADRGRAFTEIMARSAELLVECARRAPQRVFHWITLYWIHRAAGVVELPPELAALPAGTPNPWQTGPKNHPPASDEPPSIGEVLIRRGLHADPSSVHLYKTWLRYSRPRWGGSLEQLEDIPRWAWEMYGSEHPHLALVRYQAAILISDSFGSKRKPLEERDFRNDLIRDLEAGLEAYPRSHDLLSTLLLVHQHESHPGRRRTRQRELLKRGEGMRNPRVWFAIGRHWWHTSKPPKPSLALDAYRQSLALGDCYAPLNLADILIRRGGAEAEAKALRYRLMVSPRADDLSNLQQIAHDLASPRHGEPDRAASFLWRDATARLGHPSSMNWMGQAFHQGISVEKDPALAEAWWRAGAARQNVGSMAWLAKTVADPEEARAWLELAAQQGDKWAKKRLAAEVGR